MKIVKAHVEQVDSGAEARTLVILESEKGTKGAGEIAGARLQTTLRAELESAVPKLLGQDPLNRSAILLDLTSDDKNELAPAVLSSIEAACLDLAGKELGVPAYQLCGGPVRARIRACAVNWQTPDTAPESLAGKAAEIVGAGFTALEVDPFTNGILYMRAPDIERAVGSVSRIRELLGNGVDLIVDAKGRFTAPEAIRIADALLPLRLLYLQDPVPCSDLEALAEVRRATPIPIAVSRYGPNGAGLRQIIERQLADFIHLDCARLGGISRAREFALMAESWFINVTQHHQGGPVAWALNAQIAASVPNCLTVDFPFPLPVSWSEFPGAPTKLENGVVCLPDGPGLGIDCSSPMLNSASEAGDLV